MERFIDLYYRIATDSRVKIRSQVRQRPRYVFVIPRSRIFFQGEGSIGTHSHDNFIQPHSRLVIPAKFFNSTLAKDPSVKCCVCLHKNKKTNLAYSIVWRAPFYLTITIHHIPQDASKSGGETLRSFHQVVFSGKFRT